MALHAILFDLDGTLADTAPDMAYALNQVLREYRRPTLPLARIRPLVSRGGRALIELGFGIAPEHPLFPDLHQRFLAVYADNVANESQLFPGMATVLARLEACAIPWGIVTNKPESLTDSLVTALGLGRRAGCVVGGDTLATRKPHPAPLFYACEQLQVEPARCLFVGDAPRDVEAGQRAGMRTIVALFGYIGEWENPREWGADATISAPLELVPWFAG